MSEKNKGPEQAKQPSRIERMEAQLNQLLERDAAQTQSISTQNALIAQQSATIDALLAKLNNVQNQANLATQQGSVLDRRAEVMSQRMAQNERFKEWVGKSSQEKSQDEADRQYPPRFEQDGSTRDHRWRVELVGEAQGVDELGKTMDGREPKRIPTHMPVLEINADSAEVAQIRYQKLCSIIWLKGPTWRIQDLGPAHTPAHIKKDEVPANNLQPPQELIGLLATAG